MSLEVCIVDMGMFQGCVYRWSKSCSNEPNFSKGPRQGCTTHYFLGCLAFTQVQRLVATSHNWSFGGLVTSESRDQNLFIYASYYISTVHVGGTMFLSHCQCGLRWVRVRVRAMHPCYCSIEGEGEGDVLPLSSECGWSTSLSPLSHWCCCCHSSLLLCWCHPHILIWVDIISCPCVDIILVSSC